MPSIDTLARQFIQIQQQQNSSAAMQWLRTLRHSKPGDTYKKVFTLARALRQQPVTQVVDAITESVRQLQDADNDVAEAYSDAVQIFADCELTPQGRIAIREDQYTKRLRDWGHDSSIAVRSLKHGCAIGLFCVEPVEGDAPLEVINQVVATEVFLKATHDRLFRPRRQEVILLLHGIRTFAFWQPLVTRVLEEIPGVTVQSKGYGYLTLPGFLFPFGRDRYVRKIAKTLQEIQGELRSDSRARVSVIAHSNGTYIITRALKENPGIFLHRLVLCGSIVESDFPWEQVRERVATRVVNDFGTKDMLPVLAKIFSWGYGDTGRHKFISPYVRDRAHLLGHSDFFAQAGGEQFVRTFWKPWFQSGKLAPSDVDENSTSPLWLSVLSVLPMQWILLAVLIVGVVGWRRIPQRTLRLNAIGEQVDTMAADIEAAPERTSDAHTWSVKLERLADEASRLHERDDFDYCIGRDELTAHTYADAVRCLLAYSLSKAHVVESQGARVPVVEIDNPTVARFRSLREKLAAAVRNAEAGISQLQKDAIDDASAAELLQTLESEEVIARLSFERATMVAIDVLTNVTNVATLKTLIEKEKENKDAAELWRRDSVESDYVIAQALLQSTPSK